MILASSLIDPFEILNSLRKNTVKNYIIVVE